MMKSTTLSTMLSTVLATTLAFQVGAHEQPQDKVVFVGDTEYRSFCKAVLQDDVALMRRSFNNKVGVVASRKRDVYQMLLSQENLACNGKGIIEFSKERKAEQVLSYLQTYGDNI